MLADGAAPDEVQASYGNGILEVWIPSHEKVKVDVTKVPVTQG